MLLKICFMYRRLGHEPKSCEGDVETVQKALLHGLFANAAVFDKTEYDDAQKHHTGQDIYCLIHNTGPGNRTLQTPPEKSFHRLLESQ